MILSTILISMIAGLHILILVLEMFLWTRPLGLQVFRQSLERAETQRILAANQGLYNGFLSAGLIWGLVHPDPFTGFQIQFFFLGCVLIAGLYGGMTFSKRILYVQAFPALIAGICLWTGI